MAPWGIGRESAPETGGAHPGEGTGAPPPGEGATTTGWRGGATGGGGMTPTPHPLPCRPALPDTE